MGVIALGIGFGAPLAVAGALLHVITHASAKGTCAFFGAEIAHCADMTARRLTGCHRRRDCGMPWTGPMFLVAAFALCGLPLSGIRSDSRSLPAA